MFLFQNKFCFLDLVCPHLEKTFSILPFDFTYGRASWTFQDFQMSWNWFSAYVVGINHGSDGHLCLSFYICLNLA